MPADVDPAGQADGPTSAVSQSIDSRKTSSQASNSPPAYKEAIHFPELRASEATSSGAASAARAQSLSGPTPR